MIVCGGAIALLGDPEFLLLDEPINGLDPEGIKEIRDVIVRLNKEKKITFLISSHLLDELSKVVTRYGIIDNGTLIEELDAKELKDKCKNKLVIEVNDVPKSAKLISKKFAIQDIVEKQNSIEILSHIEKAAEYNEYLVKEGISVNAIYPNFDSLEEYFMKRIGG